MPPPRARVIETVQECNPRITDADRENVVGVLLRDASAELYTGSNTNGRTIFPHALLAEVLTPARVLSSLPSDGRPPGYSDEECLRRICGTEGPDKLGPFAHVFAVLLLCDKPRDIFMFFAKGVEDMDFPFEITAKDMRIRPEHGKKEIYRTDLNWPRTTYDLYYSFQWAVFLPCFSDSSQEIPHQEFPEDTIMPWHILPPQVKDNITGTTISASGATGALRGGHSSVRRVIIHDGHYDLRDIPQVSPTKHLSSPTYLAIYLLIKFDQRKSNSASSRHSRPTFKFEMW